MPDAEALVTLTLKEQSSRTQATILVEHRTKAHRDAHVGSGMEAGMQDALALLEQVARSLG